MKTLIIFKIFVSAYQYNYLQLKLMLHIVSKLAETQKVNYHYCVCLCIKSCEYMNFISIEKFNEFCAILRVEYILKLTLLSYIFFLLLRAPTSV